MNCIYTKNNIYFKQNGQILRFKNRFSLKFLRELRDSDIIVIVGENKHSFFDILKLGFYFGYLDYACPNKKIILVEKDNILQRIKENENINKEIMDDEFKIILSIIDDLNLKKE